MPNSDMPLVIKTAIPTIIPSVEHKLASDFIVITEGKSELDHFEEWPENPYNPNEKPMFARAVFPRFAFVGPLPIFTAGLCGLAPVGRSRRERMKLIKACGDQAILLSLAVSVSAKAGSDAATGSKLAS